MELVEAKGRKGKGKEAVVCHRVKMQLFVGKRGSCLVGLMMAGGGQFHALAQCCHSKEDKVDTFQQFIVQNCY